MPPQKRLKVGSVVLVLLLVVGEVVVFQPDWIVTTIAKQSPQVLYFVETEEPVVALTIDDGPDPATTPKILDVLNQHDARATFFLITSRVPGNEEVVRRIIKDGHELANHLTTDERSIKLSLSDFEKRLLDAHGVLSQFSDVRWFRPGAGWYNAEMLSIIHRHGYRCVLGSVHPFDPQLPSSWFAAYYILSNVRPGSIIILHDYGARGERTATALATILPELDQRGFRVVTLSELVDSQTTGG
ncbi:MAG: chitin deacetylase family protein [Chloroflexota bacterium]|nr:chitin deacetylase family protein [Chloroflexota bacterium]